MIARFYPGEMLNMHSAITNDDQEVNFRGYMGNGNAMIWDGRSQYQVPIEWLSRNTEESKP